MSVEISTIGILPELSSSAPDNLNGTVWSSIDKITKYSKVVLKLMEIGNPETHFFLLSDRKFHENGFAEPTRLRTVLLVSQNMENYGYVVRFHPIRHRPYFELFAISLNKSDIEQVSMGVFQVNKPDWWPNIQTISIFSTNYPFAFDNKQASGKIYEFPHDGDIETLASRHGF